MVTPTDKKGPYPRPISPHLQVYKPQISSMLSITHRMTGFFLAFAALLFTCFLFQLSIGEQNTKDFMDTLNHPLFLIGIWGGVWALSYHFLNGIRHLLWDVGKNFEIAQIHRTGWFVIIGSLLVTFYLYTLFS